MKSDNTEILVKFYTINRDKLVKMIGRRIRSDYDAEDVVQIAFERALLKIHKYDPSIGKIDKWFNALLFNAMKDFRNEERDAGLVKIEEEFSEEVERLASHCSKMESVAADVEAMPEPRREIVRQFVFLGYKAKSISQHLEINIHSVRKHIQEFYNDARHKYGATI